MKNSVKAGDVKKTIKAFKREVEDENKILDEDIGEEPDPNKDLNAWRNWDIKRQTKEEIQRKRVKATKSTPVMS